MPEPPAPEARAAEAIERAQVAALRSPLYIPTVWGAGVPVAVALTLPWMEYFFLGM